MCGDKFICIYDDGAIRTINVCVWKNDDYNRFVLLFCKILHMHKTGCSRMISMRVQLLHSRTFEYIWLIHKMMSFFSFNNFLFSVFLQSLLLLFSSSQYKCTFILNIPLCIHITKARWQLSIYSRVTYKYIPPKHINMKFINFVEKKKEYLHVEEKDTEEKKSSRFGSVEIITG